MFYVKKINSAQFKLFLREASKSLGFIILLHKADPILISNSINFYVMEFFLFKTILSPKSMDQVWLRGRLRSKN